MASNKYRKKPVVIEAFQINKETPVKDAPEWLMKAFDSGDAKINEQGLGVDLKTLEGVMLGSWGDWIIQGVKGEIYSCRDDIFQATYEPAE